MQLTLDPGQVRACMNLWRETLTLPGHARGARQEALLSRVSATLIGWCDLLRMCRVMESDDRTFQELTADIMRFRAWIDDAMLATKLVSGLEHLDARSNPPRFARAKNAD
jgi:hypothetical protein